MTINIKIKKKIKTFCNENPSAELLTTYLYFVSLEKNIQPVIFPMKKLIYQNQESALEILEKNNEIYKESEIRIKLQQEYVNEQTKKVYICPFSGKVFGDNTCDNPQDAIYDWVSKCPENNELVNGVKSKRFLISEDPDIIKSYIKKDIKESVKKVFVSVINGKLFNTKEAVINDVQKHYLQPISIVEVQNQNKFEIEKSFIEMLSEILKEKNIAKFVEELSEDEEFLPIVSRWIEQ